MQYCENYLFSQENALLWLQLVIYKAMQIDNSNK